MPIRSNRLVADLRGGFPDNDLAGQEVGLFLASEARSNAIKVEIMIAKLIGGLL